MDGYTEYTFKLPDGSERYEIASCMKDVTAFQKMHGAVSFWPTNSPPKPNPFNEYQQTVLKTYGDGDYAHLTTLDECHNAGDTLFTFLMIELADKEGCDSAEEAIRRVNVAIEQLEDVAVAIERSARG